MAKFAAPSTASKFSEDLRVKSEVVRPVWANFSMARIWWQELEFLSNLYGMQSEELIEIATSVYPHDDKAAAVEAYLFTCLRARASLAGKPHALASSSYGLHARASRVPEVTARQEGQASAAGGRRP